MTLLLLAWSMTTGSERTVSLPVVGVLPETCTLYSRLGVDCPGCGLTRCFIHLAHGRIASAWGVNPVGILLFIYVGLQIPLAIAMLARFHEAPRDVLWLQRINPWNEKAAILLLLALLVQWIVRLTFGAPY
jgi:hypothetical protein